MVGRSWQQPGLSLQQTGSLGGQNQGRSCAQNHNRDQSAPMERGPREPWKGNHSGQTIDPIVSKLSEGRLIRQEICTSQTANFRQSTNSNEQQLHTISRPYQQPNASQTKATQMIMALPISPATTKTSSNVEKNAMRCPSRSMALPSSCLR